MTEEKQVIEKNEPKKQEPAKIRLKLLFSILILSVLFAAGLYVMINDPKNYLALGIIGLVMLCFIYLITDLSFKLQNEKAELYKKEHENIYKAQKVSYLFMKRSHMDLEKLLSGIKQNSDIPAEELIDAQKAIGKVTIQRNKENIKAIVNANNEIMNRIIQLEDKMKEMMTALEIQRNNLEDTSSQREIITALENTQISLKDEMNDWKEHFETQIDSLRESIAAQQAAEAEAQEKLAEAISMIPEEIEEVVTEELAAGIHAVEEAAAAKDSAEPENKPDLEYQVQPEDTPVLEEIIQQEDDLITEDTVQFDNTPDFEDTAEFESARDLEYQVQPEDTPVLEETVQIEEPAPEETGEPEETFTEGAMTPDEIASMLGGGEPDSEKAESVAEEKPPIPDFSEPGHVMTPEEIASLLAGM